MTCGLFWILNHVLCVLAIDPGTSTECTETWILSESGRYMSGPGVCVCNSSHNSTIWRAESHTHLSKKTRPSTEHSRKASDVRGIPSRLDDQLRWVLIARSQV